MESPQLPAPMRTVFLESGEEVAEYSGSDFGVQPEWDKRDLIGQGIIFRGLSSETFHQEGSVFPPARSILYNLVTDPSDVDPWGMFFSDLGDEHKNTSVMVKQVRAEFRRTGGRPFLSSIVWVETQPATKNAPAQGYYKLSKYVRNATPDPKVTP